MKRENQICSTCGSNVQDGDVHFDHIIPYSKGGSSDESNVRLLCDRCNEKRSDRFEHEYLVQSFAEHTQEHFDVSFLGLLLDVFTLAHEFKAKTGRYPKEEAIAGTFAKGKITAFEGLLAQTIHEFEEFFGTKRPAELTVKQMHVLRLRWGFSDGRVRSLADASAAFGEEVREMVVLERALLARAGWYLKEDKFTRRRWEKK